MSKATPAQCRLLLELAKEELLFRKKERMVTHRTGLCILLQEVARSRADLHFARDELLDRIRLSLGPYPYVNEWLYNTHPCSRWGVYDPRQMLAYRLRWLDALIEEYAALC